MFGLLEVRVPKSKNMEEHAKTTEKPTLINLADKKLEAQSELDEFKKDVKKTYLKGEKLFS